jgi:hypothetical protein
MAMELSIFTTWQDGAGRTRREFSPFLRIGSFQLCIDRDGIDLWAGRWGCGWNRFIGFWARNDQVAK